MALFPGKVAAQYKVSGLVEFTYRDYEAKVGGKLSSSYSTFTQAYNADIASSILDPRFLLFQGGVGYTKTTATGAANDSDGLNYNLSASFFPGSKISWDLYGRKSTTSVQSLLNLAGYNYDVNTTSYGGTLNLRLSRGNGNGNGRNNNFNNSGNGNSNFERWSLPLPDIMLAQYHDEMESLNIINPMHQTRDNTKGAMQYRLKNVDMFLDGMSEQFKDLQLGTGYDQKTANFDAQARLSPDVNLGLRARLTDRTTSNMAGFNPQEKSSAYGAQLDFAEKNGLRQYYRYDYTTQENQTALYTTNNAEARLIYRYLHGLSFHGGLTYGAVDYSPKQNVVNQSSYTQQNAGLLAAAAYNGIYRPEFLDPFTVNANYEFNLGYSSVTAQKLAANQGSGLYYSNTVGAGIISTGWKTETLGADARYTSRRDHSAAGYDVMQQSYSLNANTTRITKTNVRFQLNYNLQTSSTNVTNVFLQQSNSLQQRRSLIYHLDANYTATQDWTLGAGVSKDHTTSNVSTLSTLTPSTGTAAYLQTLFYGAVTYQHMITRSVQFRGDIREEYRIDDFTNTDTRSHRINMNLDYRIRMILVSLEYHWQEDVPNNALRTTQETFIAKISRPF